MEDNEMCVCCGLALVARDYERGGKSCFNCDTVKDSSAWEELTALRARVAELEVENKRLRAENALLNTAARNAVLYLHEGTTMRHGRLVEAPDALRIKAALVVLRQALEGREK